MGKYRRWKDLLWGQGGFRGFERGLLRETPSASVQIQAERYNEDDGAPSTPVPNASSS